MNILVAGCKINLGLHITGRRADGYHELDSLFYPLSRPADRLHLRVTEGRGLRVFCDAPGLDQGNNTLTRAYAAFVAATRTAPGLEVTLRKGIPIGSGLGGGSSDAAALLRWLNARAPQPLSPAALVDVGLRVGADVPFFLQTGPELKPCRVRGVGEHLEPAGEHLAGLRMVLVCPPVSVSTPQAYADYDAAGASGSAAGADGQNDLTKTDAGANGTFLSEARPVVDLRNDLEAVVFARHPQLAAIKAQLLRLGAFTAAMSGSGSSIIGLFQLEALVEARAAAALLQEEGWRVYAHTL